jgi:hypothetical protein
VVVNKEIFNSQTVLLTAEVEGEVPAKTYSVSVVLTVELSDTTNAWLQSSFPKESVLTKRLF